MTERRPYTFDRVVRLVITIVIVLAAIWLIDILKDVLLPFLVACLIAYLFEPFVQFNRRLLHLRGRVTAIFVTLFEAVFFLAALGYFIIPVIVSEINQMADVLSAYASSKMTLSDEGMLAELHNYIRSKIDFHGIAELLKSQQVMGMVENTLSTVWSVITGSISVIIGLFNWLIVILYVVFIMIDYERLSRGFRLMVPPKMRGTAGKIGRDIKDSMNHYFRGQALIALIVGVLFSIGFTIIDLPMAILLGMFIGVLNLVPYLQLISLLPTTLLCMVYAIEGGQEIWPIFLESIAVYCVVQVIQDFFLTPKIMGKAMGLNPAIILLSLSVWGTLLGMVGLIIALPLTTLLLSYYNTYIIRRDDTPDNPAAGEREAEELESAETLPFT